MASEIHGDLASIHDEDLLRRMWQQSEDFGLKKEIRTHMYKVREERLRNFYSTGIMDSSGFGPTKTPLTPSHGESLADHSFQSLKAKEIRDSESPSRDFRISHTGVSVPDTSGWNIVTSTEMSPDGRARKTESTATTEGIQQLPGGHSEFAGKNKHMTKVQHEGDDQNYIKKADESTATQFHERTVVGDENSGRVETKSSSTTSSSHVSTKKFSSTSNNMPYAITDQPNISREFDDLVDRTRSSHRPPQIQRHPDPDYPESHQRIQNERYTSDDSTNFRTTTNRREVDQTENKTIQKEVDLLAAQPGIIISRSVDYPDPNTKVITETKQLPDGTTVTTRKYETKSASSKTFRSSSNQQHSTATRTVTEDRAQKQQIEYLNEREAERIRQQQQQLLQNQVNKSIRNVETNDEFETTTRRSSVQNIDNTDKSVRKENLVNQVETVFKDNEIHRTVKKDLSQKYRNQDFIDTERRYSPEPEPIHPSQRIDRTTTSRETTTVTEDIKQFLPAAGKPSYNTQKPSPSRGPSATPERTTPSRDSCSPPYSGRPSQQPEEFEIPIDTSGYPRSKVPDSPRSRPDERQPSPYTKEPQSTPAAGKPSYNTQPPAGKPSYTKSVQETQKTSKEVREVHVERIKSSPQQEPDYSTPQSYDSPRDRGYSPQDREIPVSHDYEPHSREPYSPTRPGGKSPTKPREREVTTTITTTTTRSQQPMDGEPNYPRDKQSRPGEYEIPLSRPSMPDGRQPYKTPREPSDDNRPYPNNRIPKSQERETITTTTETRTYRSDDRKPEYPKSQPQPTPNERYIPITRSTQPDEFEPTPAAGKPSYTTQPTPAAGKPSYTPTQRDEPYRAPSQEPSPKRPSNDHPNDKEQYPAGKPSYTPKQPYDSFPAPAAGKPSYTAKRPDDTSSYQPSRESPRNEPRSSVPRDMYPQEFQYEPRGPNDYPTPRDQDRRQYIRRPSEESRVSTDTVRTNNTYITNKISVEVDAAHDTFARSLRCVSPSDRGSVKSLRTSTTSVRSSPSDKRSPRDRRQQRSPSRDSITYSESSRISTSTVTKGKTNIPKDRSPKKPAEMPTPKGKSTKEQPAKIKEQPTRRTEPQDSRQPIESETSPQAPSRPSDQPDQPRSTKRPDVHRSNETVNSTTTRKDSTHHITTIVKQIEEYPGEKKTPTQPSLPTKSKPAQITPKHDTTPKSRTVVTRTTANTRTSQVPTSVPNVKRQPQKQTPSPVIGKPRQSSKPETVKSAPKSTVVANIKRTTQSEFTKTSKEPRRSPQQLLKTSHPDTPKAPKSPRSSPERSSTPQQPSRTSPSQPTGKSPREPKRNDAPNRPAAGIPSDNAPRTSTKFTKTIQINNATLREEKPSSRGPKRPTEKYPHGSDDEGFEPESPRSSSPTSSVSDLVYQKGIPEPDGSILTTNRKVKTDEFIKTEKRDVETIENRETTVIVDDSTFKRKNKKAPSPSPDRYHPQYESQRPKDNETEEPIYSIEDAPGSDAPKEYPTRRQPDDSTYPRNEPTYQNVPRHHSPSPERAKLPKDALRERFPNGEPKIGPFIQPSDTDESYEPAISDIPRTRSPDTQLIDLTDEEKPREPFYLIEPHPSDEESRKHPDDTKTPKKHPQSTRSETYEERCRKILGMDRQVHTTDTSETTTTRKSSTRGVTDFITTEQIVDQRNRSPKKPTSSQPDIPSKVTPRQQQAVKKAEKPEKPHDKPSQEYYPGSQDEISPDDANTYEIEEITETVRRSSPAKIHPERQKSPEGSPRRLSPDRRQPQKTSVTHTESVTKSYKHPREPSPEKIHPEKQRRPKGAPRKVTPETSPDRKKPNRQPTTRSPDSSPSRQYGMTSPAQSPTRRPGSDTTPTLSSRKPSKPQRPDDERSPTREPKSAPTRTPSRPNDKPTYPETTSKPVPQSTTKTERIPTESPSRRKPSDKSPTRRPGTSPTRTNKVPTERRPSPQKLVRDTSPVQKPRRHEPYPDDKYCENGEIVITTTTRTVTNRSQGTSPSRTSPDSRSPVRKSPTRHAPEKTPVRYAPEKSSTPRSPEMSPTRRAPEKSPTRYAREKSATYRSPEKASLRHTPEKSPTRRAPESETSRRYSPSPERSPVRQLPRDTSDRIPSRRPTSQSPSRKFTERIPNQTKPDKTPINQTPGRVSSRSPSPRSKYVETVTIVTETTTKETPKGKPETVEPQSRPNHVTTAKIHLSPPVERKPSSIAVKKSPKTPYSTPAQTTKSPREDTTTVKTPKSTVPRVAHTQRTEEKLVSTKRKVISTEDSRVQEKIHIRKRPEEESEEVESEPEEQDSDVNSDAEDVTTVIEATTTTAKNIPEKRYPGKKYPFTDRKDSAPVYRTTHVEKDKMIRSTSENLIKTKSQRPTPEIDSPLGRDSPRRKSLDKKRPIKCVATKTITITGTDNLMNSEDMENVIIDIQQAKSSREPSPNRIVPTPVRPGEDTGIPRYPDTVQEPEDGTRRRPKIKDIPIFEEDSNDYVRCHISEVREQDERVERRSSVRRRQDEEHDERVTSVTKIVKGRQSSPDYAQPRSQPSTTETETDTDDHRLTVHDKVAKFISTAEEVKKPKPSAPFSRDPRPSDTEPDDCLLSVNEKVSKFLTTAEKVTKPTRPSSTTQRPQRPDLDDIDDELKNDESVLSVSEKVTKFTTTIEKLAEDAPQRSPKLVANIERQVSKKDEFLEDSDQEDSPDAEPVEPIRRRDPLDEKLPTRISIKDRYQPDRPSNNKKPISTKPVLPKSTEVVKKAKSVFENNDTTKPKQRDILTRPSVWEHRRNPSEVKLEDIGVHKPFDDETEEIIKRERSRSRSPGESENEPIEHSPRPTHKISDVSSNSVSSRKNIYESHIITKSASPKAPARKEDTPTPYSSRPEKQPSHLRKPDAKYLNESSPRKHPQELNEKYPSRSKRPNRESEDDEFIEEVTETTTTTTRSDRRSPSRRCEYYSPERDRSSPIRSKEPSPTRSQPGKTTRYPVSEPSKNTQTDSSPRKYSRRPDETTSLSTTTTTRVDQTKSTVTRRPSDSSPLRIHATGKHTGHLPSYMEPTVSSLEHRRDSTEINRYPQQYEPSDSHRAPSHEEPDESAPTSNLPSYMDHTISSMEHRRDSVEINKTHSKRTSHDSLYNEPSPRSAKFGVELKRTDVHDSSVRRKSSSSETQNIEEIFDLELLEKMLETVVGYEQRRRIRTQIRIVRKMIEEGTLKKNTTITTTTKTTVRKSSDHSPVRKTETHVVRRTETSPDGRVSSLKRSPHGTKDPKSATNQLIESESRHITHHEKKSTVRERSTSPVGKVRTTTTTTEVRRLGDKPVGKKSTTQQEEKPIWATKNILKKPSEKDRTTVKRTTTSKTQRQIVTKDDADCITSSYGIGPTDEDGKPLFGIRALKKKPQQSGETTKITGSIVTESYYSENGAPPVGERKVTVYSNNPDDITDYEQLIDTKPTSGVITKERTSKDGLTSVTRVQKIGKQKEITSPELPAITDGKTTKKEVKMVRKGSVKEMSEKFTKKGSTTSITEKNTSGSYPKAGLILRTQNYSSTENDDPVEECNIEIHTTRKQSRSQAYTESDSEAEQRRVTKTTKTFLNSNGEKVTGVEDVLDRMRNADNVAEDGDTPEDREARSLLNKFLGASVLMSGVESMVPKGVVTRTIVESPGKHEVRTTRVTKTITSGGNSSSPVARKTCDIEEIWDEEYLKQLLEQSTNYEERRRIRAQIRRIMAEKQACTEVTTKIKAERKTEQQQSKAEVKTKKVVIETDANEEESDTESEYEEVEVVEEVTDDSSAEGEEEDEEEEVAEEEEEEEEENEKDEQEEKSEEKADNSEESDEESAKEEKVTNSATSKTAETLKHDETAKSAKDAKPETSSETSAEKTEVNVDELSKEQEAKEQKASTTETTETKEKDGAVVTTTTKVTTRTIASAPKPVSPFAKFRQLDKQNSQNSPNSPSTPMTPGGANKGAPLFQFTDPALSARAATVKEQLLQWCQMKTKEYENVQITNFSTSWSDGLAFCALIHHFLPDAFDYSKLTPKERRHNFELAFRVADEKADIAPLLDVEDMVVMRKPDWKCVFTYVQSIFRRFRNCS